MSDPNLDPTVIRSDANGVYLKQGAGQEVTLTTDKVLVNSLKFTKYEIAGAHATVQIDATLTYNSPNPQLAISKTIQSAVARASAATFDADLLPNVDNTYNIGQLAPDLRWKNGRLSGDLTVAGNVGAGVATPVNKLDVEGGAVIGATYSGTNTAPANGLLVEGNVGIGTTSVSTGKLVVAGNVDVSNNKVINLATPTASADAATKGYVDAAAGGGGVKYWELKKTVTTYNGNLGGYDGANAKCVAEFGAGAVMANTSILSSAYLGGTPIVWGLTSGGSAQSAWFPAQAGTYYAGSTTGVPDIIPFLPTKGIIYAQIGDTSKFQNCNGWTSGSSSYIGSYWELSSSGGPLDNKQNCNASYSLLCAIPK